MINVIDEDRERKTNAESSVWTEGRIQSDREKTRERLEGQREPPPPSSVATYTSSVFTSDTYGKLNLPNQQLSLTEEMLDQIDGHLEGQRTDRD